MVKNSKCLALLKTSFSRYDTIVELSRRERCNTKIFSLKTGLKQSALSTEDQAQNKTIVYNICSHHLGWG